jgi:peptidoglycan hydrolase CwlO-like protein
MEINRYLIFLPFFEGFDEKKYLIYSLFLNVFELFFFCFLRGLIGKSVRVDTTVRTDTERERLTELEQALQKANSQLQDTRQQISSIDSEHSRQKEEVQRLEKLARQTTLEVNHFTEQLGFFRFFDDLKKTPKNNF